MVDRYIPERGDIIWIDFSPQAGREQAGHRPALVVSPSSYNQKTGLMVACPITSKVKGYPFEVRIRAGKIDGAVLADQVKNLDWTARTVSFEHAATADVLMLTQRLIGSLVSG